MQTVTLSGKTNLGKNRVRELGATWVVTATAKSVPNSPKAGPWLNVQPPGKPHKARWINLKDDIDFTVEATG